MQGLLWLKVGLKGQSHEIFDPRFFPKVIPLVVRIRREIRKYPFQAVALL
jgi:hypothetical protein